MPRKNSGVLLLAMGGPPRCEDVGPYLLNLFSDPMIVPIPGGPALRRRAAWLLSRLRLRKAARRYRAIGGGSPLGEITQRQARALEKTLADRGHPMPVSVAMRYWRPCADEAVAHMAEKGIGSIVALPLYPQYSTATTGSSLAALKKAVAEGDACGIDLLEIESWCDHPGYLACVATRIERALALTEGPPGRVAILFVAHSVPVRLVKRGDPYVSEVERTVRGVVGLLDKALDTGRFRQGLHWEIAYQSRLGPVAWVGPRVEDVIQRMIDKGWRSLMAVPVSFVSDHLETLYDIDVVYKNFAYRRGVTHFVRIEPLNDAPDFISCMADLVTEKIRGNKT